MEFRAGITDLADRIIALFTATFTASEGAEEGALIGKLVDEMFRTAEAGDLHVFSALEGETLAGCIVFSRLTFEEDDRTVFILAPVAVETGRQGKGVGRALLTYGLGEVRKRGVDVAVTYGDPAFYGKVGFVPVTAEEVPPPRALNHPEGWLAQSLADRPLAPLKGRSRCVAALDHPEYW